MAKRNATKTAKTANHNDKPENAIAGLSSINDVIVFALRHVTTTNIVAMLTLVRSMFGGAVGNKNVGRITGWRVMDFQNRVIALASTMDPKPTLLQLVWIGAIEYPGAVGRIFAPIIPATGVMDVDTAVSQWSGTVSLFNRGRHENVAPAVPATFAPGIERATRTRTVTPAEPLPVAAKPKTPNGRLVSASTLDDKQPRLVKRPTKRTA